MKEVEALGQCHYVDVGTLADKFLKIICGLIGGAVVDDDELEIGIILRENPWHEVDEIFVSVLGTYDYGDWLIAWTVVVVFFLLEKSQTAEKTPNIAHLNQPHEAKNA